MGHQDELAVELADAQGLDGAVGALLAGVEVLHVNRLFLLESLGQLKGEGRRTGFGGQETHGSALLGDGIGEGGVPASAGFEQLLEKRGGGLGISQGAMGGSGDDAERSAQTLQAVAAATETASGDTDGVDDMLARGHGSGQVLAGAAELTGEEGEIKADVVAEDNGAGEMPDEGGDLIGEGRLAGDHQGGDAGEGDDAGGDGTLGVDELLVLGDDDAALEADHADFDNAMAVSPTCAGGFDVDERERDVAEWS